MYYSQSLVLFLNLYHFEKLYLAQNIFRKAILYLYETRWNELRLTNVRKYSTNIFPKCVAQAKDHILWWGAIFISLKRFYLGLRKSERDLLEKPIHSQTMTVLCRFWSCIIGKLFIFFKMLLEMTYRSKGRTRENWEPTFCV